jgi:hypothetical protein
MLSFSERMQEAKDVAAFRRYKGQSVGSTKQTPKQYADRGSWQFLAEQTKRELRAEYREIINDYRQSILNFDDDPNNWGEF